MGTTQHVKYFQVIEYILFFCLCGLSIVFMRGVLDQFFSGKTSFSQSEEPIKELPTIVICQQPKRNSNITKVHSSYFFKADFEILNVFEWQLSKFSFLIGYMYVLSRLE